MRFETDGGFMGRPTSETAVVLADDRELGELVEPQRRDAARRVSVARVLRVRTGLWDARAQAEEARQGYGLLLLDGLLVRRVGLNERVAAELLGPGDLLRPFEHDGEEATLPFAASWRVLAPVRLAVLDRRWSARLASFPEVGIGLTARA